MDNLDGFVVYSNDRYKKAFAVTSSTSVCKANATHIPNKLKQMLVEIEDRRFYLHQGFDVKSVLRAIIENIKSRRIIQGGSTITQQLARNLLESNEKTFFRKFNELIMAIQIEKDYSKEEILELYFDNIYFGKNIRGVRAASLYYFGKEVEKINQSKLLLLLTILRGPNYYVKNKEATNKRYYFLNKLLEERGIITQKNFYKNSSSDILLSQNNLQILRNDVLPYITISTNINKKKIYTSINYDLQNVVNRIINESHYPISVVAVRKSKIVAFGSTYGSNYSFTAKSNVGSTLKPFIYCCLRDAGVLSGDKFSAEYNTLGWPVREVERHNSTLSIEEALIYSNNNVFINAAVEIGMEKVLKHLSSTLNMANNNFYPSSILGATNQGISLYELALAYSNYFQNTDSSKKECLQILNRVFKSKTGLNVENIFLKTGTTNGNKERFAVIGDPDLTFAILRNENYDNDPSKEGSFMGQIARSILQLFNPKKNYKWS